jgi:hypothetical protein
MKNIKNTIAIILLLIVNNTKAQSIFSNTLLQNKTWIYEGSNMAATEIFNETMLINSYTYNNKTAKIEELYYLSETMITEGNFEATRVGASTVGKYIITPKSCYEIISLTDKNLIIRNVKQNFNIYLFVK